ncbi:MAG: DUF1488 domain-containing protein [Pseudobdellovibrionaceae bacterium]|nr:DUF1488 domain-containing protein [Pseudobdellovibrionaceae bacterium]
MNITFSDGPPNHIVERECLEFEAYADGTPVSCSISIEALIGPDKDLDRARIEFEIKKEDVHRVAKSLITKGEFIKGEIAITTASFRDMTE